MDEYEIITGEFIEQPKWDWNLCKFAEYIFRDGKNWYFSLVKPSFWKDGWRCSECFRIPEGFTPIYSGSDENSLMKRP